MLNIYKQEIIKRESKIACLYEMITKRNTGCPSLLKWFLINIPIKENIPTRAKPKVA
jgi:hypothetical protein